MSSYYKKTKSSKSGELRYGDDLLAPKLSSLCKASIYLSSLFLLLSPSAQAGIHLLPDVQNEEISNTLSTPPVVSIDSAKCEETGYRYYASGVCPEYHIQEVCVFSDKYLKCDADGWCRKNGYTISSCVSPKIVDAECLNGTPLYKYCICPPAYKYTCTGMGYSSGSGAVCEGNYTSCNCATNYVWNGSACVCDSSFKYSCSGTGYSSGSGVSCGGKYKSCNCSTYYSWNGSACVHTHSYTCPSGYKTSSSGMISPVSTSKVCALSGCGATSGTCYKEGHSHSYSCPSGYSTSCSYGYSGTTSKKCSCGAKSGTCYSCLSRCEADPCASGCYEDLSCSYGCDYYNSCGGCSSCSAAPTAGYCSVHGSYHGNCCTDGTYQSCDTRCGGSGCSSSSSSSSSGGHTPDYNCPEVVCSSLGGTYSNGVCSEDCYYRACSECRCNIGGGTLVDGYCTETCMGMCATAEMGEGGLI